MPSDVAEQYKQYSVLNEIIEPYEIGADDFFYCSDGISRGKQHIFVVSLSTDVAQ